MALGSKVLGNGLVCYAGSQSAEKLGQPCAGLIVADLSARFARQGKAVKPGVPPTGANDGVAL